jgi:DNA-binding MarR family transcriptional regulator
MSLPAPSNFRMVELAMLDKIANGMSGSACCPGAAVNVSEINKDMFVTKSAVSQTLNVLEKEGYITREMDRGDRRKITVTLTPQGESALKSAQLQADQMLETVVSRFGEDNTKKLIELFEKFMDTVESLKEE